MNAADAMNAAIFALKQIVATAEDHADDDPAYGLERAEEIASSALAELAEAGFGGER